ncbi:unnamed protein product, partial [Mesorhabditis belari]|uniref:Ephrin RBD domain-containing protein n=1 Tax=Mesorhabditis belari TaxID=2138241 RepID=A0AAF3FEG0_9BILA
MFTKRLPDIYWNVSNPMMEVFGEVNDRVQIVCPFSKDSTHAHQTIIYRVSQEDFFDCRLGTSAKEVGRCISPKELSSLSIVFRTFSPNPFALEYHPDQTYYFISTSDGSTTGLHNKVGGLCETDGMKMMIHLAEKGHPHRHHHRKPLIENRPLSPKTTEKPVIADEDRPYPRPYMYKDSSKEEVSTQKARVESWPSWPSVPLPLLPLDAQEVSSSVHRLSLYELEDLAKEVEDRVEFQIHEFGDAESLAFSSSPASSISRSFITLLLLFLHRLFL